MRVQGAGCTEAQGAGCGGAGRRVRGAQGIARALEARGTRCEVYVRGAGRVRGARTHLVHLRAQPAEHRHAAQPPRLLALQALQLAAERVELGRTVGEGHGAQLAAAVAHGDGCGEQGGLLRAYERAFDEGARRVEHAGRAAVVCWQHVRVAAPLLANPLENLC